MWQQNSILNINAYPSNQNFEKSFLSVLLHDKMKVPWKVSNYHRFGCTLIMNQTVSQSEHLI